jgi:hypothetical protein
MDMHQRIIYDPNEDVVWVDMTDTVLTSQAIDGFVNGVIELAATLSHKVYALICWKNVSVPSELANYYGEQSAKAAPFYLGFIRYEATNPYSNVIIRTQAVRTHPIGSSNAQLYPSKEAALEAVHKLRLLTTTTPQATPTLTSKDTAVAAAISEKATNSYTTSLDSKQASLTTVETALSQQVFYDSPFITVSWETELHYVLVKWKKYAEGEDYRAGLAKVVELFQLRNSTLLLSDSRQQGVVSVADQTWTTQEWRAKVGAAGLRKTAILLPEKAIAQLSLNKMLKSSVAITNNTGDIVFQSAYFSDVDKARSWLLQKS